MTLILCNLLEILRKLKKGKLINYKKALSSREKVIFGPVSGDYENTFKSRKTVMN